MLKVLIIEKNKKFVNTIKNNIEKSTKKYKVNCSFDIQYDLQEPLNSYENYNMIFIDCTLSKDVIDNLVQKYENTKTEIIMIGDSVYHGNIYTIKKNTFKEDYILCDLVIKKYYEDNYKIIIPSKYEDLMINAKNIIYIEIKGHTLYVYTTNKNYVCCEPIQELVKRMDYNKIIQIHRSFLVNLDYIYSRNNEYLVLENGVELTVGRKYYNAFDKAFNDYLYSEVLISKE